MGLLVIDKLFITISISGHMKGLEIAHLKIFTFLLSETKNMTYCSNNDGEDSAALI